MMLLHAKMKRVSSEDYPGMSPGKIIILNEGSKLVPFNYAHNALL